MTTTAAPATTRRPGTLLHLGAIAQLAALGVVGSIAFTILFTLLSVGVGLVLVFGIGLLFLVAFVYALYASAWVEYERVEGLYRYGLPALRPRRRERAGFGGWLRSLWHQFTDGPMWRGVASVAIATVLGLIVLPTIAGLFRSIGLLFAPLRGGDVRLPFTDIVIDAGWAVLAGALGIIVALAILLGIALLHRVLTRAILVPSREAILAEEARTAAEQARTAGAQREGAVRASEVERTRIERDLHDGVQPRLVSVGMTLGLAQQKIDSDPAAAKALIDEAHTSTKAAITELRQLARGIHTSVLDDRGLDAALSALAARSPIPVALDVRIDGRCSATAEAAVYFTIAESLTNAAKHSRGSEARVVVRRRDDGTLWARVEDNGIGGAHVQPGGGLDGIMNRIVAAGGTPRLDSPAGGPTALEVSVPCAS
ncbi:sensor histidine kinase [Microbacterium telephonicum]|uniref:histidine kinase n=1 Tax=Microbacterium telephonicum TaxID=1714841 RepID=A0A498CAQ3_9MICO|nr:histidine kinase [Microbacterium telephonicum]RLK52775.1 signal transduction histidine kinase [Microbacterium telephonicum]